MHLMYWNGGEVMRRSSQYWQGLRLIYTPFLQCQLSQNECSVGMYQKTEGFDYRCKLSITDLRNRLKPDIVEAVKCLHWWLGGGLINDVLSQIVMDEEMDG